MGIFQNNCHSIETVTVGLGMHLGWHFYQCSGKKNPYKFQNFQKCHASFGYKFLSIDNLPYEEARVWEKFEKRLQSYVPSGGAHLRDIILKT